MMEHRRSSEMRDRMRKRRKKFYFGSGKYKRSKNRW